jgi:hypothetical protein
MNARRTFLAGVILLGLSVALADHSMRAQNPTGMPPASTPIGQEQEKEGPPLPNAEKEILKSNDKDIKKKVDRLYLLATELKEEVDKTDSTKVLSLNLMKKTEEIEKLARDIRNRSKG